MFKKLADLGWNESNIYKFMFDYKFKMTHFLFF